MVNTVTRFLSAFAFKPAFMYVALVIGFFDHQTIVYDQYSLPWYWYNFSAYLPFALLRIISWQTLLRLSFLGRK